VLVLLAVLVSAPECARSLIGAMGDRNRGSSFIALVEELAADGSPRVRDSWTRLLGVMRDGPSVHDSLASYRRWGGTIARFSFETWDLTELR
jgi:hypothetical protein